MVTASLNLKRTKTLTDIYAELRKKESRPKDKLNEYLTKFQTNFYRFLPIFNHFFEHVFGI